jgi:hypothetical protein
MKATLRDVLSRVNVGTMYGTLEVELGSDSAPEHQIGTEAVQEAIRFLKTSTSGHEDVTEFEIQYENGNTYIFYLDASY